jgi:hypothetical protein
MDVSLVPRSASNPHATKKRPTAALDTTPVSGPTKAWSRFVLGVAMAAKLVPWKSKQPPTLGKTAALEFRLVRILGRDKIFWITIRIMDVPTVPVLRHGWKQIVASGLWLVCEAQGRVGTRSCRGVSACMLATEVVGDGARRLTGLRE